MRLSYECFFLFFFRFFFSPPPAASAEAFSLSAPIFFPLTIYDL